MSASAASAAWMRTIGSNVRSVKFLLCPASAASKPAMDFFTGSYNVVKHLNPTLPYAVRAAPGKDPMVVFEFDFGQKAFVPLGGLDAAGVERKVRVRARARARACVRQRPAFAAARGATGAAAARQARAALAPPLSLLLTFAPSRPSPPQMMLAVETGMEMPRNPAQDSREMDILPSVVD